jgi:hypothetical protein
MKAQHHMKQHPSTNYPVSKTSKSNDEVMKRFYQQLLKNFGHVKAG